MGGKCQNWTIQDILGDFQTLQFLILVHFSGKFLISFGDYNQRKPFIHLFVTKLENQWKNLHIKSYFKMHQNHRGLLVVHQGLVVVIDFSYYILHTKRLFSKQ